MLGNPRLDTQILFILSLNSTYIQIETHRQATPAWLLAGLLVVEQSRQNQQVAGWMLLYC
jgi:predicted signal transduction protein with EAL and GGDEF domain